MISKQDFLGNVRMKVIPVIQKRTEEEKLPTFLITQKNRLIFAVSLFILVCCFFSYQGLALIGGFSILGGCVLVAYYKRKMNQFVKQQIFPLFNLEERRIFADGFMQEISQTGIVPHCDEAKVDDSFVLKDSEHSLFVQEAELVRGSGKHSHIVFNGLIINSTKIRWKNISLLLWDKSISKSHFTEAINRFVSKLVREKVPREKIICSDEKFAAEYDVYASNQIEAEKALTSQFIWAVHKLKSVFKKPMNLWIDKNEITLAIPLEDAIFECFNWKNFSDLSLYEKFYDEIQCLHFLDEVLYELESRY